MAPLVILVGKNNTGKSYMATLLNATNAFLTLFKQNQSRLVCSSDRSASIILS
jgi:polynucleotide 5'-kinase involved in rRNA processing